MKNIFIYLLVFVLSSAIFLPGLQSSVTIKSKTEVNDSYIYIRQTLNGKIYVFVYLNDGVTLVNIYEDED